MPANPIGAANAIAKLEKIQARFRDVQEERRLAILEAVANDVPLREVARAANCSHESVRRVVAANGAVSIELGANSYPLTQQQVELLIYKLAGYTRGAFPKDVELLGAGAAWLPAAGRLAEQLETGISDEDGRVIALNDATAFALYQVLRLTYTGRPTTLSRLYDSLLRDIGGAGSGPAD